MNSQNRNSPGVFFLGIKLDKVVEARQALTLRFERKRVGDFAACFLTPCTAESGRTESLLIELLTGGSVEAVSAKEACILVPVGVCVLRNQEAARISCGLPLRAFQRTELAAGAFHGEMIHEVV